MRLGRRTAAIMLLLLLATALATHLVQQHVIYPQFVELERGQARRNAELILEVLNRELALLAPQVQDWAYWDDTYRYLQERNQDYVEANLIPSAQQSLDVQLLAYYDNEGRKVWSRGLDLGTMAEIDIDLVRGERFPADIPLLPRSDQRVLRTGLVDTNLGLLFVTAAPILPGSYEGPQRGSMVMGRFLEPEALRQIASQNRISVRLDKPRDDGARLSAPAREPDANLQHAEFSFSESESHITVSTQVFGLSGRPALDIAAITPREISQRGREALQLSLILLVLAGVALTGVVMWMLHRDILGPLQQLTRMTASVGSEAAPEQRLGLERDDEIGELADGFDRMLERLARTRQRLLDQSYKAGASEMAGGIIRDLRESLGPLRTRLESPLRLLDQAQSSTQLMLLQQLSELDSNRPKFAEVLQMLQEGIDGQASLLSEARGELRQVRRQLEQTQDTLNEYARYLDSRAELAPVSLSALLDHALRLLSPSLRGCLRLDLDESVARVGNVVASRELLQQVVHLLMANAAQALQATPEQQGSLRITAGVEPAAEGERIWLRFDDSRPTPTTESIAAMFEPVAAAGHSLDGLSLAWAASVVTAMNGELRASASQPYDGLVFVLLLPRAKA